MFQIVDWDSLYHVATLQCLVDLLEAPKASLTQICLEVFVHRFCNRPSILVLWMRLKVNLAWVNLQAEPFIWESDDEWTRKEQGNKKVKHILM